MRMVIAMAMAMVRARAMARTRTAERMLCSTHGAACSDVASTGTATLATATAAAPRRHTTGGHAAVEHIHTPHAWQSRTAPPMVGAVLVAA